MTKNNQDKSVDSSANHKLAVLLMLVFVLMIAYFGTRSYSLIQRDDSLGEEASGSQVDTAPDQEPTKPEETSLRPKVGTTLYVPAESTARNQINQWQDDPARNSDIALLNILANTPTAIWLSGPDADAPTRLQGHIEAALSTNTMPVFVLYNIPQLGCGEGGATSLAAYNSWIDDIVTHTTLLDEYIIIVEPDAVPMISCLSETNMQARIDAISHAADVFLNDGAYVYVDAGHSSWVSEQDIAKTLKQIPRIDEVGFSLNISNFQADDDLIAFGNSLSNLLGGNTPFVIDSSRNGLGPDPQNEWCNPFGRSVGKQSKIVDEGNLEAYLWIKVPGESDAACNGGPTEGHWWAEYALDLVRNSNEF